MIYIERIDDSNRDLFLKYYQWCKDWGTLLKHGLPNPDNKQIQWFKDNIEDENSMDRACCTEFYEKGLGKALKEVYGSNKTTMVKYYCWIHNQLDGLIRKRFVFVGEPDQYQEALMRTLESFGCEFMVITHDLLDESKQDRRMYEAIGYTVCRNAWMKTTDPLAEINKRPKGVNTVFCEISGTNNIANYEQELFNFYQKHKADCIVVEGEIPLPNRQEIEWVGDERELEALTQYFSGFQKAVLYRFFTKRVLGHSYCDKNGITHQTGGSELCMLAAWFKRYFGNLEKGELKTFFYFGPCTKWRDALFLQLLAEFPIDVIILNPEKKSSENLGRDFLVLDRTYEVTLAKFPTDKVSTCAASVERVVKDTLQMELFSKPTHYDDVQSIILDVTQDDIQLMWNEEISMRPGYSTEGVTIVLPTMYAQVTGLGIWNTKQYCNFVSTLAKNSNCIMLERLKLEKTKVDYCDVTCAWNGLNFKLDGLKRVVKHSSFGILSAEKRDLVTEVLKKTLELFDFKSARQVEKVLAAILGLPSEFIPLIQNHDLQKVNPKCILVLLETRKLDFDEELVLHFLHYLGFDVVLFVPSGYGLVSDWFVGTGLQKIDLSNYNYNLQFKDFTLAKLNPVERFLYKLGSF